MLRDPRESRELPRLCPECARSLCFEPASLKEHSTCGNCGNIEWILKCSSTKCKFHKRICVTCFPFKFQQPKYVLKGKNNVAEEKQFNLIFLALCVSLGLISLSLYYLGGSESDRDLLVYNSVKKLREDYPSQRNETWHHFFGVLEKKPPTVKSIIFLHGADKRTADCLMSELVSLFSGSKEMRIEDITFSGAGFEGVDYGLALEHYHRKVKNFKVFVADLTVVSGNMARIFHSLCDEVSSDIKPSLFVFFLKREEEMENLKPLERATSILKRTWRDLPDNELYPLLSRVVKNVVDVVPETKLPC